jgi:hypothetical protein
VCLPCHRLGRLLDQLFEPLALFLDIVNRFAGGCQAGVAFRAFHRENRLDFGMAGRANAGIILLGIQRSPAGTGRRRVEIASAHHTNRHRIKSGRHIRLAVWTIGYGHISVSLGSQNYHSTISKRFKRKSASKTIQTTRFLLEGPSASVAE